MKNKIYVLIFVFFYLLGCTKNKTAEQRVAYKDILIDSISNLNPNKYIGRKISEFLNDDSFSKYRKIDVDVSKPSVASSLIVYYNNGVFIKLIPSEFKYMNPYSEYGEWNIDELKKEKIGAINLYFKDMLIKSYR